MKGPVKAVVIVVLLAVVVAANRLMEPPRSKQVEKAGKALVEGKGMGKHGGKIPSPMGLKTAPVRVDAVIPQDSCQKPAMDLFKTMVAEYPTGIYVRYINMGSPEASKLKASCATIFVNGKSDFTLKGAKGVRKVHFGKGPGQMYEITELRQVIEQELSRRGIKKRAVAATGGTQSPKRAVHGAP